MAYWRMQLHLSTVFGLTWHHFFAIDNERTSPKRLNGFLNNHGSVTTSISGCLTFLRRDLRFRYMCLG
jgi:hypothetical protein